MPRSGILFLLLAFGFLAASARASIEGSPHDLIVQGYDVEKASWLQERCTSCHLTSSPVQEGFLPEVPPVLERSYGASSIACFSCHDGTTIVSPDVDASRTVFDPAAHGFDLTAYEGLRSAEVGLPYLAGKRMECVTCHDPHDNGHRPFLRADIGEICLKCHSPQSEFGLGGMNSTGNHPQGADPAKVTRKETPLENPPAFRTPFPAPYPLAGGRTSLGVHWDLGGHLSGGASGTIGCVTCHAIHGDEQSPPQSPGLLSVAPGLETADLFCEGCHAGKRGDDLSAPPSPNPGGTTTGRTYHPVDNDRSNGVGSIIETRKPEGWPLGTAVSRPILCSTCHRAHGAQERGFLVRRPPAGVGFCEVCHEWMSLEYHHPLVVKDAGRCAVLIEPNDPVTGLRRTCDLCHRAHNAGLGTEKEQDYLPLLRESHLDEKQCLICHPRDNPTCNPDPNFRASHFIGDPTLPETYASDGSTLRRAVWPGSGTISPYGGVKGTVMLCISCHAFKGSAVVSGDKGKSRFLRALSGNPVEWAADEGVYLCTGCHKANPGTGAAQTGRTHPLLDALVERLGHVPLVPATATFNGHVNCDSCHRPHEAATAGGYYILEAVAGTSKDPLVVHPTINFSVLCRLCHEKY